MENYNYAKISKAMLLGTNGNNSMDLCTVVHAMKYSIFQLISSIEL